MTRLVILLSIFVITYGCSKEKDNILDSYFLSEIVGFDYNCSTCILSFPYDSLTIKQEIGPSEGNYYNTINLHKDTFNIDQRLLVKLRKPKENEIRGCITFYPTVDYLSIYIIDYKHAI
jgi:hypothetical protein